MRTLAKTRQHVEDTRTALVDAETGDAAAYSAAVQAGWTEQELRRVGFGAPARRAPGRPRAPRRGAGTRPGADPANAPANDASDGSAGTTPLASVG
ncbi:hypothetical protein [Angustibacter aerolatus]|uniref:Uncharacterized protein n=1 Tax=Angustibacter aerolatus TaxID=1162965 RepID=A0ABQ6JMA1_9ACTN|nr:hypothetical protein [Angustibacter aerolatus]GMA89411.1 hypothetical protein GCM10025868_46610 [Angustibacter aerolatus]